MIKVTKWRPDTCDCVIEYSWDDSEREDVRTYTVTQILHTCSVHQKYILDKFKHFDCILDENQRKNQMLGLIVENMPDLIEIKNDDQGQSVKQLKPTNKYKWSFDENRVLIVEVTNSTPAQKNKFKELADQAFGVGKVIAI